MNEKKNDNKQLYFIIIFQVIMLVVCYMKISSMSREIDNMRYDYLRQVMPKEIFV